MGCAHHIAEGATGEPTSQGVREVADGSRDPNRVVTTIIRAKTDASRSAPVLSVLPEGRWIGLAGWEMRLW